jgi:NADH dehydrogenase
MPIRGLFSGQRNVRVLLGQVTGVDAQAHEVLLDDKRVPYDALIVVTGARHAYFGHDDWEPFAPGLKQIEDATAIRRRILIAFEHAEAEEDPDERRRRLTFAVIGAGPTGVELAGAVAELAKVALAKDFLGVEVPTSAAVTNCAATSVTVGNESIPAGTITDPAAMERSADQISGQLRQERCCSALSDPSAHAS